MAMPAQREAPGRSRRPEPEAAAMRPNGALARPADGDANSTETVLEPARIAGLLSASVFPPLLVSVVLPSVREVYTSALLKVDAAAERILLDALSPEEGHALVEPGTLMHVHGKLHGVQLDFATRVLAIHRRTQLPAYLARMPGVLRYHQRRKHFRLSGHQVRNDSVIELGSAQGGLQGRLVDLSATGLRAVFQRDPGLYRGYLLTGCRFFLAGEQHTDCHLECVRLRSNPRTGQLEVGARFIFEDSRGRSRLERGLQALQRRQLRRQLPG